MYMYTYTAGNVTHCDPEVHACNEKERATGGEGGRERKGMEEEEAIAIVLAHHPATVQSRRARDAHDWCYPGHLQVMAVGDAQGS